MRALKLALGTCLALLLAAGSLRAADPAGDSTHKGEEHPAHNTKYRVTFHKDGKEKEATFDTSKPAEARELSELLAHGHVAEMKKEEPVNLLALSWDLGLWTVVVFLLLLFILS